MLGRTAARLVAILIMLATVGILNCGHKSGSVTATVKAAKY